MHSHGSRLRIRRPSGFLRVLSLWVGLVDTISAISGMEPQVDRRIPHLYWRVVHPGKRRDIRSVPARFGVRLICHQSHSHRRHVRLQTHGPAYLRVIRQLSKSEPGCSTSNSVLPGSRHPLSIHNQWTADIKGVAPWQNSHRVIVRSLLLLALPALFVMEPSFAGVAVQAPPSLTVRYGDLNLNSTQGVADLYKRIQVAATEVCRPAEGPQSVSRWLWTAWNSCFYHALAEAVGTVHNDKLSAYHWQRVRGWGYQEAAAPTTIAKR